MYLRDIMRVLLQHTIIVPRSVVYGIPLLAVVPDKAERELNAESQRAVESQGDTITIPAMRSNTVITELVDGWLEALQALLPQVSTQAMPEVAEEVGVPKVLEGVIVKKIAFALTTLR
jgi:hypothetical protein